MNFYGSITEHKQLKYFKGKREKGVGLDIKIKNIYKNGTSLEVQSLRLHLPGQGVWVPLVGELNQKPRHKTEAVLQ